MRKVKFLVNTAYQGPRKEGEVLSVPDDFAARWVKNGIAAYVGGNEPATIEEEVPVPVEEAVAEDATIEDYSTMSAKDLYALCKDKGIDVEAKKGKEYYIEKLNA